MGLEHKHINIIFSKWYYGKDVNNNAYFTIFDAHNNTITILYNDINCIKYDIESTLLTLGVNNFILTINDKNDNIFSSQIVYDYISYKYSSLNHEERLSMYNDIYYP